MNYNAQGVTALTVTELAQFVDRRGDIKLNAKNPKEAVQKIQAAIHDLTFWKDGAYERIDDPGHGYLVVPRTDVYAAYAAKCASSFSSRYSNKRFIFLEEDGDAPKFRKYVNELNLGKCDAHVMLPDLTFPSCTCR